MPDREAHQQLLQDFLKHIQADRAKLIATLEQNDKVEMERTAHRMKGSGRMMGAKDMANICATIEQTARDGDMNSIRSAFADLDEEIDRLEAHITGDAE